MALPGAGEGSSETREHHCRALTLSGAFTKNIDGGVGARAGAEISTEGPVGHIELQVAAGRG